MGLTWNHKGERSELYYMVVACVGLTWNHKGEHSELYYMVVACVVVRVRDERGEIVLTVPIVTSGTSYSGAWGGDYYERVS